MTDSAFNSPVVGTFWRYIASTLDRLVQLSLQLDQTGLHWCPPAPATNSVATLVVHTLGNAEENLLEALCGQSIGRQREREFLSESETTVTLARRWRELRPRLEDSLAAIPATSLDGEINHPRRGMVQGREVLIIVARHAAEHLGQAELTRDLWEATR